ncbi:MAG: sulfatase [Actinobacteria bacterium]|nr:sulfatase [Actinomycetota bacterium]
MTRRKFCVAATVLLTAVLLGGTATFGGGAESAGATHGGRGQPRPNVLVLMTDDQTVESLRVMGNVRDLLAEEGATFTNSFVGLSLCCPSRSTFLTGQYAHNHGVRSNMPPSGGYYKLDSTNTLPVWLERSGYHTAHIGKYLNRYGTRNPTEVPPGWSEWYGSVDPSTYRFYDYTLNENGRLVTYGSDPGSYQTDVYGGKAVDFIRRSAPSRQPFFLSVAFLAPHSGGPREAGDPDLETPVPAPRHRDRFASEPLPRPASFNELDVSDKPALIRRRALLSPGEVAAVAENYRQRLESLLAVDEAVRDIVVALRASGELENTLIVFTADNGFFHGEHRVRLGKVLVYEPSIRVPLILRGPGVRRGQSVEELVANVDLAPTILDAARARPGRVLDGRSLLALTGKPRPQPARPPGEAESGGSGRDILIEGPATPVAERSFAAIRSLRYIFVVHATGERELYDLVADPDQLVSRHDDPALAGVRAELGRRLARLGDCAGATCREGPRPAR